MALGLMREIARMSSERGITHWCAVMMPALLRLLARLGIHFHAAGPPVQYHGKRQPCYREGVELLEQVRAEQPAIWAFLTDNGRLFCAPEPPRARARR
jgi:N-acyl amino acid synthase of PEP-CTERM/exosortase system